MATMQSVVTGQAPITAVERKITSGGKHIKQKIIHTMTETNRMRTSDKNKKGEISVRTYQTHTRYNMLNESQQKPKPRRQHDTHKKKDRMKQTIDVQIETEKEKAIDVQIETEKEKEEKRNSK